MSLSYILGVSATVSARTMAQQIGVSYNTGHRAATILRMAILAHAEDAEVLLSGEKELDESWFGGRRKGKRGLGAAGKVPVFGILSRGSQVFVQDDPDCRAETLLQLTVQRVGVPQLTMVCRKIFFLALKSSNSYL